MRSDLPSGTVTFLFTDVEGSTRLLQELGTDGYAQALAEHRRELREAFARHDGAEVDTQGDAFFYAFPTARGALEAAREGQERLSRGPISVRMGIHTGTPHLDDEGYVGEDVHRAARIAAVAHGGQVVVSGSTATLVEVSMVDLGEHRLKDLSAPERIYQLGTDEFPPLKSLHQSNLPVPSTPFVGRERELTEVAAFLARDDVRLLTLTGPGGSGKTRLAAQAAGLTSDLYPHGVWWVPLAALRDAELVLETAAQVLGAKNRITEHIGDKRMLVLFDNFEQVVAASGDVAELLASCPNLRALVTSREPLRVTAEQEYPVRPFVHEEGVGFFLSRARAARPDFRPDETVSEICRRLDDLPLALELAAARVKALSTDQILQRLEQRLPLLTAGARDLPERQQTLRAAIAWSYDLLSEEEQRLFARLSVFSGGCTLDAAEDICEAELDTLQSLVDKSLLRHTEERYWILETIREYAAEKLEESREAEDPRRRHAEHFLALAEEAQPHLWVDEIAWVDRLDADLDNLRAASDRIQASGDAQRAMRLEAAISRFWNLRGRWPEGRRRVEAALAADDTPTPARATALNAASALATLNGDYETARLRAEESLALHESLGDSWGIARSRFLLGFAAVEGGDFEAARAPLEESLRLFQELGDEHTSAMVAHNLAWALSELGDVDRARTLSEENLRSARALGNERLTAFMLDSLASNAQREGRIGDAFTLLKESLPLRCGLRDPFHLADTLSRFASALAAAGSAETAAHLLAYSEKLLQEAGLARPGWSAKARDETLDAVHSQLNEAAFAEAWEAGGSLTQDEAVALALES